MLLHGAFDVSPCAARARGASLGAALGSSSEAIAITEPLPFAQWYSSSRDPMNPPKFHVNTMQGGIYGSARNGDIFWQDDQYRDSEQGQILEVPRGWYPYNLPGGASWGREFTLGDDPAQPVLGVKTTGKYQGIYTRYRLSSDGQWWMPFEQYRAPMGAPAYGGDVWAPIIIATIAAGGIIAAGAGAGEAGAGGAAAAGGGTGGAGATTSVATSSAWDALVNKAVQEAGGYATKALVATVAKQSVTSGKPPAQSAQIAGSYTLPDGSVATVNPDGSVTIREPNGTTRVVGANGQVSQQLIPGVPNVALVGAGALLLLFLGLS